MDVTSHPNGFAVLGLEKQIPGRLSISIVLFVLNNRIPQSLTGLFAAQDKDQFLASLAISCGPLSKFLPVICKQK